MKVEDVLAERGEKYGEYCDVAGLSQRIKAVMASSRNWDWLFDFQRESLEMMANKMARVLNGNWNDLDGWLDMSGYAKLSHDELVRMSQCGKPEDPEEII